MTLNIAVLGPGGIAREKLLPALRAAEGARLWSVLSRDRGRAAEVADAFGAAAPEPAFDDLDRLLADPALDAVIVATPDGLHAPMTIAAAKAGKHVLTEKPMTTAPEAADAMIAACAQAGVTLAVAYHLRWHRGLRGLHAGALAGRFGTLRHMRVQWSWRAEDDADWRAHDGLARWWGLSGVGTHCLDQALWFLGPDGGEVEEMRSVISRPRWGGAHDETAVVALRFVGGATAELCSSVLIEAPSRWELYGSAGWAAGRGVVSEGGGGTIETHEGDWAFEVADPYRGEIEDFVGAIREGRPPEVDGAMGRRNVALLARAAG